MRTSATGTTSITSMLKAMHQGNPLTVEELFPVAYRELRKLAARKMAGEAPGQTLQATALVNEAWIRLAGAKNQHWENRAHFFAAAGEAMRRILVENARRKKRLKRGGQLHRVEFDEANAFGPMPDDDLLALDEALERLALIDARAAQVVNLCYFGGLTQPQAAKELAVSLSTIERSWSFARAWLFREIQKSKNAGT